MLLQLPTPYTATVLTTCILDVGTIWANRLKHSQLSVTFACFQPNVQPLLLCQNRH